VYNLAVYNLTVYNLAVYNLAVYNLSMSTRLNHNMHRRLSPIFTSVQASTMAPLSQTAPSDHNLMAYPSFV